jgi:hypothetical protein
VSFDYTAYGTCGSAQDGEIRSTNMDKMKYEKIAEMERPQAEVAKSFLEAEGIDVELFDESVWKSSYAITFQPVQIFVPREKVKQAMDLLKSFNIEMDKDEFEDDEEEE